MVTETSEIQVERSFHSLSKLIVTVFFSSYEFVVFNQSELAVRGLTPTLISALADKVFMMHSFYYCIRLFVMYIILNIAYRPDACICYCN